MHSNLPCPSDPCIISNPRLGCVALPCAQLSFQAMQSHAMPPTCNQNLYNKALNLQHGLSSLAASVDFLIRPNLFGPHHIYVHGLDECQSKCARRPATYSASSASPFEHFYFSFPFFFSTHNIIKLLIGTPPISLNNKQLKPTTLN